MFLTNISYEKDGFVDASENMTFFKISGHRFNNASRPFCPTQRPGHWLLHFNPLDSANGRWFKESFRQVKLVVITQH